MSETPETPPPDPVEPPTLVPLPDATPPPLPPPLPAKTPDERPRRPRRPKHRAPTVEPRVPFFKRFSNALLGWEVLRAGRRTGSIAIARTALGGTLLAAIWALYAAKFGEEANVTDTGTEIGRQLNAFAESFAFTFFIVQSAAVLLLTPVYVAGAIFEERDTRSGEVLLTTQLTRREVYVGKLGARMVQVLLVVLAGMPILFLTSLWGGVGIEFILICYTATFTAIFGAGVVTAAISAYAETMRGALLRTYGMLALVDGVMFPASPFVVIASASGHWAGGLVMLIVYLPMQFIIVMVGYYIGQRWLRMAMLRQKRSLQPRYGKPPPLPGSGESKLPPLHDDTDPLLWKEVNAGGRVRFREGVLCLFTLPEPDTSDQLEDMGFVRWLFVSRDGSAYFLRCLTILIGLILACLTMGDVINSEWVARVGGFVLVVWMMAAVGLTAAGGISKERQKQTLIDLLMLPGPRSDLLKAKLMGALVRALWPSLLLLLMCFVCLVGGGLSLAGILLLLPTAAGLTLFAAGLGIWLSARCRTQLHATAMWLGLVATLIIGTFLLAEASMSRIYRDPISKLEYPEWSYTINPGIAWAKMSLRYDWQNTQYVRGTRELPWPVSFPEIAPALVSPVLYALIGFGLWRFAARRFEREGRA